MVGGAVAFKVSARTAASVVAIAVWLAQADLSHSQPSVRRPPAK
jgi:hypothetical protein